LVTGLIEEFAKVLIFGAIKSGVYALLALGFTLIYGISGVVNLAHGSFYMLGAYLFFVIGGSLASILSVELIDLPLPLSILALIGAVVLVAIIGSLTYRLTIHPVLGDEVAVMVVTVCVALIFQQLILIGFGATSPPVSWPGDTFLRKSILIPFLNLPLMWSRILAFSVSLILFVSLVLVIARTKIGKAMRAVSQDREVAMLVGVNTNRLYTLTMGVSAMLAAIASILITTSFEMYAGPWMWLNPLALSFSIVILGGLGSIKGSLVGAFILGYAEQGVIEALPEGGQIIGIVPLIVMVSVLLIRPKGLFGKRIEMEE